MAAATGKDGDPDSGEHDLQDVLDPVNAAGVSDPEQVGQRTGHGPAEAGLGS